MIEVFLYSRSACEPCLVAEEQLQQFLQQKEARLHVIKIDGDQELEHRYGRRIPVVEVDGVTVCELQLDLGKFSNWISSRLPVQGDDP